MTDFKKFPKILSIDKIEMSITQKIDGTNGQIFIYKNQHGELDLKAGCRTRWLTLEDDNHGFCKFVLDNKQEIISFLGEGRHFGEWAGKGINSGDGLDCRIFFLFNWKRWGGDLGGILPKFFSIVPILYCKQICYETDDIDTLIDDTLYSLRTFGSVVIDPRNKKVNHFKNPEGIVIQIGNQFFKSVFEKESKTKIIKNNLIPIVQELFSIQAEKLLHPIRLQKILSSDEKYIREYPQSIKAIIKAYVKDLEEEGFLNYEKEELRLIKKSLGSKFLEFLNNHMMNF